MSAGRRASRPRRLPGGLPQRGAGRQDRGLHRDAEGDQREGPSRSLNDEFAEGVSEFKTLVELRARHPQQAAVGQGVRGRRSSSGAQRWSRPLGERHRRAARRGRADASRPEMVERLRRLHGTQGVTLEGYMAATGMTFEQLVDGMSARGRRHRQDRAGAGRRRQGREASRSATRSSGAASPRWPSPTAWTPKSWRSACEESAESTTSSSSSCATKPPISSSSSAVAGRARAARRRRKEPAAKKASDEPAKPTRPTTARRRRDGGRSAESERPSSGPHRPAQARVERTAVREPTDTDGGRADQPRRARLRHLLPPAQRTHHLPGHGHQRPGGQPGRRPAAAPGVGGSRQGHLHLRQQPRRQCLRRAWPSTTPCSSSSPTSPPSAWASPCRWGRCCWRAGPKGKRYALPNSKILIHQVSGGFEGPATDIEIHAREALSLRKRLDEILAEQTGQALEKVEQDTERDYFMTAEESLAYGIIDKILEHR